MFKKKLLSAACVAAGLGLGAVYASAQPSYLYPTGDTPQENDYVQLMEDAFYETLIRLNPTTGEYEVAPIGPDTIIQPGDIFAGVQRVQATELAAPEGDGPGGVPGPEPYNLQSGETFTQIFLIETLTSVDETTGVLPVAPYPTGNEHTQTFTSVDASVWEAVFGAGGLLDISAEFDMTDLDQDGTNGPDTQVSEGTMTMLFQGALYPNTTPLGSLSTSATSFVASAELQYEFGFTGAGGAPGTDEFWVTSGEDSAFPAFSGTTTPGVKIATNITQRWAGPELEQHIYRQGAGGDADFTGPTHFQGEGGVAQLASGTPWGITGDLDFYIRPVQVPEPAPLALIALGLVGLGFGAKRRKMSA